MSSESVIDLLSVLVSVVGGAVLGLSSIVLIEFSRPRTAGIVIGMSYAAILGSLFLLSGLGNYAPAAVIVGLIAGIGSYVRAQQRVEANGRNFFEVLGIWPTAEDQSTTHWHTRPSNTTLDRIVEFEFNSQSLFDDLVSNEDLTATLDDSAWDRIRSAYRQTASPTHITADDRFQHWATHTNRPS